MADPAPVKKRHHYVPITYLDGFTDDRGRIQVYLCDQDQGPDLEAEADRTEQRRLPELLLRPDRPRNRLQE